MKPIVLGVMLAGVVLSCVTTADAQTAPTIYYACYVPLTGTVYRIKETNLKQTCTSTSHVEFSWNAQGSAGPAGPPGPQGPAGGVAGWEMRTNSFPLAPGANGIRSVTCSAGKFPLGGGAAATVPNPNPDPLFAPITTPVTMTISVPFSAFGGLTNGWTAGVLNNIAGTQVDVTVYAVCATRS